MWLFFRGQLHLCVSRQFLWLGEGFASGGSHCEQRSGVLANVDLVEAVFEGAIASAFFNR